MKCFFRGIAFGLSLVILQKFCVILFDDINLILMSICSGILFFVTAAAFLTSDDIRDLLLCGFSGLFAMFAVEILGAISLENILDVYRRFYYMYVYVAGFFGTMAAVVYSIYLTVKKQKFINFRLKEANSLDISKSLKIKLLIYALVSALGFSYMILAENAGISVLLYALIQLICVYFITPDKKRLLLFIPILILSLNSFISASTIWRTPNLIICFVLMGCMSFEFDFKNDSLQQYTHMASKVFAPLSCFSLPFKWLSQTGSEKAALVKRIVTALIITVPCTVVLICMLSSADMVFSMKTSDFLSNFFEWLSFNTIFKLILGIIAGLYLFGTICGAYADRIEYPEKSSPIKGDLVIINILLCAILSVYTLFVIIQFKYLFAGSALPDGLSYTEYARKGFFELLALTGINIAVIFAVTNLTKPFRGRWATLSKSLCTYLCAVTIVLLISSFYRMQLYTNYDGLTRLRFFVMGFLVFELLGLLVTFIYIIKPKFNLSLIYVIIALTYYSVLNMIPSDYIIAKNQIDKYLSGEREDLHYVFTLSADAAPAMEYLFEKTEDKALEDEVQYFLEWETFSDIPHSWQSYNLSTERAKDILKKLK